MPSFVVRRFALRGGLAFAALAIILASCLASTEIRLHVHTNVPCTDAAKWKGVAVYLGSPGAELEDKSPVLTSTVCDANGEVGSLVVVPSGAKDAEVGVRVVAGLTHEPEDCAANHYQGCIVARRALRFNRHSALDLQIELTSECVNLGCDATTSCINGTCTDAHAVTEAPLVDAGPTVRCGDNGVVCPTEGKVCCLSIDIDAGTTFGQCKFPADCMPPAAVLNCDDETDCVASADDAGHPGMCLLSFERFDPQMSLFAPSRITSSACVPYQAYTAKSQIGLELCESRQPCFHGTRQCDASYGSPANPLPNYFWCLLDRVQ